MRVKDLLRFILVGSGIFALLIISVSLPFGIGFIISIAYLIWVAKVTE